MPTLTTQVTCPINDSFRVRQISGMFDLPLKAEATESFTAEFPSLDDPWQVGLIVGPSGSGKSTFARHAFPNQIYSGSHWPSNRAVIDCFPDLPIKQITGVLTSVGFSSPPSWLKPYQVLSTGEKFRCDLARALLESNDEAPKPQGDNGKDEGATSGPLAPGTPGERVRVRGDSSPPSPVVFDEFTSVVDRTVARIASAAIAKSIRSGRIHKRFIAISCHYDIAPWLEPDWVLDLSTGHLARGRLQRPKIKLQIHRAPRAMWNLFKRHHYLSADLHHSAACFVGSIDLDDTSDARQNAQGACSLGLTPATFTAVLFHPHPTRPGWREHRTVCLPDFQGIGLGSAMSEFIAGTYRATNKPYFSTTSHPALIRHRARSPLWRLTRKPAMKTTHHHGLSTPSSLGRLTAGFEYLGPPRPHDAERLHILKPTT